ncbi:Uncharacterised protein [Actinobaculum suis]|uniref:Uncharacterized protein n=1 Tax=Actinobaculum suis TaxID=1657 RepID=A0A7Z8YB09_9ACTO|nr:hypothetical protein [Actinobaculum suis]VDG77325.1 Uncharacterised protein [Actinobaculum suis]
MSDIVFSPGLVRLRFAINDLTDDRKALIYEARKTARRIVRAMGFLPNGEKTTFFGTSLYMDIRVKNPDHVPPIEIAGYEFFGEGTELPKIETL